MPLFPNHTKQQLESGQLALGLGMRVLRTVDAGMIAKTTGFDWLEPISSSNTCATAPRPGGLRPKSPVAVLRALPICPIWAAAWAASTIRR